MTKRQWQKKEGNNENGRTANSESIQELLKDNRISIPISVDVAQPENDDEKLFSFYDDDNCCFISYYGYGENRELVVRVQKLGNTPQSLNFYVIPL